MGTSTHPFVFPTPFPPNTVHNYGIEPNERDCTAFLLSSPFTLGILTGRVLASDIHLSFVCGKDILDGEVSQNHIKCRLQLSRKVHVLERWEEPA